MGRGRPALSETERRRPFDVYLTDEERDLVVGALPRYLGRSHNAFLGETHTVIRLALAEAQQLLSAESPPPVVRLLPRSKGAPRQVEDRLWLTPAEIRVVQDLKTLFGLGTGNRGVVAAAVLLADASVQRLIGQGGPDYAAGLRSSMFQVLAPDDPRRQDGYYSSIVPQAQLVDPWYRPPHLTQPRSRRFTV